MTTAKQKSIRTRLLKTRRRQQRMTRERSRLASKHFVSYAKKNPRTAADPTREEMLEFLTGQGVEEFDAEEAIYWFANDWHGGQSSNLYSALSTSEFSPGAASRGPSDRFAYNLLKSEYTKNVTRARKNPLVSKEQKFLIEAMQWNNVPMYYQLSGKGVSNPLRGLFTTNRAKGSRLNNYNARTVARKILPYLDKRLLWVKVVPL